MKKLIASLSLVLVVALGVVGFSACKKTPEQKIIGKWAWVSMKYFDEEGNFVKEEKNTDDEIIKFNKNHTFEFADEITGTWKYENGKYIAESNSSIPYMCFAFKGKTLVWYWPTNVGPVFYNCEVNFKKVK